MSDTVTKPEAVTEPVQNRRSIFSLRLRLCLFTSMVVIVTTGALGLLSYGFTGNLMMDRMQHELSASAKSRCNILHNYISQQHERVLLVASRTRLRELIRMRIDGEIDTLAFREQAGRILEDARHSTGGFLDIWFADTTGRVIVSTDPGRLGMDYSGHPSFLAGHDGPDLSPPARMAGGSFSSLISAPALTNDDRLLGVVMVLLDAESIRRFLVRDDTDHQTRQVFVGTRDGGELRYFFASSGAEIAPGPGETESPAVRRAVDGESGFMPISDVDGRAVLCAYRPLGYKDWGLVETVERNEAYAPIVRLQQQVALVSVALLVLGLTASYVGALRVIRPIKQLSDAAAKIASGAREVYTDVNRTDELGQLGRAFNHMASALDRHHGHLESQVAEHSQVLEQTNTALRHTNNELEQFIYSVSHDFMTPIVTQGGYIGCLREDLADSNYQQAQETIDRIEMANAQLKTVIEQMLDVAKIGRINTEREPVEVGPLLEGVREDLAETLSQANAELVLDNKLPTLMINRQRISEVFLHLIHNAIRHGCDENGGSIHIGSEQTGSEVLLFVRDHGPGIASEDQARVFDLFQQLNGGASEGAGMGLASVKRVVEEVGGRVWVESTPGKGATFWLAFPVTHEPVSAESD